jgi:uncharacterized cofD-like protein
VSAAGPRVVGLGGGHGLAASLQAMRRYAGEICGIVSVADDGGSSGRLRQAFGIPAPGDLRRCLVALADPDSMWAEAFEHRFDAGELSGHALGNLIIAGLASATGSFDDALAEAGRLLGVRGRVLPATTDAVILKALVNGREVEGQMAVETSGVITSVSLVPADARPPDAVLEAIAAADQIVVGPGSLFTSVLAVLAVPAIAEALAASSVTKVYVANLRASEETPNFDVADHVAALAGHGFIPTVVLADPAEIILGRSPVNVVAAALARPDGLAHDPALLAAALQSLL